MGEQDVFEARFAAAYRRYLDEAVERDPLELAHAVVTGVGSRRWGWTFGWSRSLAWIALLALLLLAAALAAFGALSRYPVAPEIPNPLGGINVLTADPGVYEKAVADTTGALWAEELGGPLVRFDPRTGRGQTWQVMANPAFAPADIAPARAGGVWLASGRTLRRFDGSRFREVLDAPAEVALVSEAPDRTLWVATTDRMILHWNGSAWSSLEPPGRTSDASTTTINVLSVDPAGRPWIGWLQFPWPPGKGWVSRYDGTSWVTFDGKASSVLGAPIDAIDPRSDGTVWVATETGLARFDGSAWTEIRVPGAAGPRVSVAAGPDGSTWVVEGIEGSGAGTSNSIRVARLQGGAWAEYGTADGLPPDSTLRIATVIPASSTAYVATGAGIYVLADGRWSRAWPKDLAPRVAAVRASQDGAWARDDEGDVWHVADGWMTRLAGPLEGDAYADVLETPDGSLWLADETAGATFVRQGDAWRRVADAAGTLVLDPHGAVWLIEQEARTIGARSFVLEAGAWRQATITPATSLVSWVSAAAVAADGTIWVGSNGPYGDKPGLARYRDGVWELVSLRGSQRSPVTGLALSPDGSVWTVGTDQGACCAWVARFDGTRWRIWDTSTGLPDGTGGWSIAISPDGTVWVPGRALARYDGSRWITVQPGVGVSAVAAAADGTIWLGGTFGVRPLAQDRTR